jgi:hypothetical protein
VKAVLQRFSLYQLLAVIIGVQAAILTFVHGFGNPGADVVAGSILGGVAVVVAVGQNYLKSVIISVPAGVYGALMWVDGLLIAILAAGGMILQYTTAVAPSLRPWAALLLQGTALIASVFSQLFQAQAALRAAAKR